MQTFREYNQNTHIWGFFTIGICVNLNLPNVYTGLKTNTIAKQVLNFTAEATASFVFSGVVFRTGAGAVVVAADILAK